MSAQSPPPLDSAVADFAFDQCEKLDCLGGPKQRFLSTLAAVPKHLLVTQWRREALRIYPELMILAPGKAELSRAQRGELMSRIATGNWDLILIRLCG
jgi:hypothetical protein